MRRVWIVRGVLLGLAMLAIASLAWGSLHALRSSADLERRAEEVELLLARVDPYTDPDMTYPPPALVVFAALVGPFLEPRSLLRGVWLVLNLGALGALVHGAVRLWGGGWSRAGRLGFALLAAASKPVRLGIGMGQFALIPVAALVWATIELRRGRPTRAGLLTALALAKPTIALPYLIFLAARGEVRALAVALGAQAAGLLAVSLWLGTGPIALLQAWLQLARGQAAAGLLDLPSVLERLGVTADAGLLSLGLLAAGGVALVACRRQADAALLTLACVIATVFTYHRPYDLVLLLPVLAQLLVWAMPGTAAPRRGAAACAALLSMLLVAPSHPRVVPEALYETVFVPACYAILGLVVFQIARDATVPSTQPRAEAT